MCSKSDRLNIVVFSPHPDDAEIAMGGAIANYTSKGHKVTIVLTTTPNNGKLREIEAKDAAEVLGAELYTLALDLYTLRLDRTLVEQFDKVIASLKPDIIYTSWLYDSHQDHATVSQATIAATRRNRCSLYMYEQEVLSGIAVHTFRAQSFIDISDTVDVKAGAMLAHKSQVEKYGDNWITSVKGRASYWGFRIGVQYAEAFEVVKEIKEIRDYVR